VIDHKRIIKNPLYEICINVEKLID